MRAHLIDARGVIHDLGDVDLSQSLAELRPDLAHLAPGSVLVTGTEDQAVLEEIATPRREVSPGYGFTVTTPYTSAVLTVKPLELVDVFAQIQPFGWPDPNRRGARKRRRGRQ